MEGVDLEKKTRKKKQVIKNGGKGNLLLPRTKKQEMLYLAIKYGKLTPKKMLLELNIYYTKVYINHMKKLGVEFIPKKEIYISKFGLKTALTTYYLKDKQKARKIYAELYNKNTKRVKTHDKLNQHLFGRVNRYDDNN